MNLFPKYGTNSVRRQRMIEIKPMNDSVISLNSAYAEQNEAALIKRLVNRDMQAFERLYEEYRKKLSHFIANLVNKPQLVEEVFNDTMMVVWQKIGDFAGASKLSTWIFAIAYRKAIRARSKIDEPVSDYAFAHNLQDNDTEDAFNKSRLRQLLNKAMETLSFEHRTVINLTYFEGLHYCDIAEIMGCPIDTVKTRMFYARRQLRKSLGGDIADWL